MNLETMICESFYLKLKESETSAKISSNLYRSALSFVYPFGCTLSVNNDAVPVLSTGTVCYPISRPICAFHTAQNVNYCKLWPIFTSKLNHFREWAVLWYIFHSLCTFFELQLFFRIEIVFKF